MDQCAHIKDLEFAEPEDAQYIFEHTYGIAGFFGVSSMERLATKQAIEKQARSFKDQKI